MRAQDAVALGLQHHGAGGLAEAEALYRQALAAEPGNIDALHFLGVLALQRGDAARAEELISQALARRAANAPAHNNLGLALAAQGRGAEAAKAYLAAIVLEPEYADALLNLRRLLDEAASGPDPEGVFRDALYLLAETYSRRNELDDAAACLERILERRPADAAAHLLLGNVRRNQARHDDAVRHYEAAIRHDPEPVVALQNLLFCRMCLPQTRPAELLAAHREFARRFEAPLAAARPVLRNAPDPGRRLRIGYLSPDFRANVVGHFMQPILERHDRERHEVHAFFVGASRDALTARIASLVDRWHEAAALDDDALAARIREEEIDVLVDLCGHGPGNRLLALARRAAPVQASYLDYSATTGLAAMDWRLTTGYCDPEGAERYYTEKLYRLPGSYWTYNPSERAPVGPLPMHAAGHVTFGSFNLYYRVTGEVLELWARLLQGIPGSRLVIVGVAPGSTREALLQRFERAGVARERIAAHGVVPYPAYHALIGSVDIALAPFPYNGATTAMDCLWNGVPVVSLGGGEVFHARIGCAVLDAAGLPELIARDAGDYVRIAARLAADPARLAALREGLRERVERSPLRDFAGFTRSLEAAYRTMWREWCAGK